MTQNGLKHILNMFLKSVTNTDFFTPPPKSNKCFFKPSLYAGRKILTL